MAKKPRAKIDKEISTTELASLCEITERRVQQLAGQGVFERLSRGWFRRAGCAAAYKDYCVKSEMDRRDQAENSKERFEAERARKLKMENDLRERMLVEMPEAIAALDSILAEVRTHLAGIPARITEDVAERRRLEDGINEVLAGLSRKLDEAGSAIQEGRDPLEAGGEIHA